MNSIRKQRGEKEIGHAAKFRKLLKARQKELGISDG